MHRCPPECTFPGKIGSQSVSDDEGVGIDSGRFNVGVAYFFSGGR